MVDAATLRRACDDAATWPLPASGRTVERLERLAALARQDLVLGRLVEAHADATAIRAELGAGPPAPGRIWAVWAAGPKRSLAAHRSGPGWELTGDKPWCSGATLASDALVEAAVDGSDAMALFAVELTGPGVAAAAPAWVGPGMAGADTRTVCFERAAAVMVGAPGDYLTRPGFWMGAVGVAACWHGGTVAVADRLRRGASARPGSHTLAALGAVTRNVMAGRACLERAGRVIDGDPTGDHRLVALAVRAVVEDAAVDTIDRVNRALGPAPLAHEADHAGLVADLSVYIRQHHAEADLEALGTGMIGSSAATSAAAGWAPAPGAA